jgi:hypothetical protein
LMKAIAQADSVKFRRKQTEWFVLDIHHLIEEIMKKAPHEPEKKVVSESDLVSHTGDRLAGFVKKKLREAGYKDLYDYIEYGETKNYHERPTCKSRTIWFDLGELPRPTFIFPDVYWKKTSVVYNADKIAIDKQLYMLTPKGGIDQMVLGGILNSSWIPLFREMGGRTVMGEGLNRNQVMVYEAKSLPIPDPRKFTKKQSAKIKEAFAELLASNSNTNLSKIKEKLDQAVLATIGMEKFVGKLEAAVEELINIRIYGGGEQKQGLLEKGGTQVIKLESAKAISDQSLDNFL